MVQDPPILIAIDHVQLAMPKGREDVARGFYRDVLGLPERQKPDHLALRGGCWFERDAVRLHLGVEDEFRPAKKAHPAIRVGGLDRLKRLLEQRGFVTRVDEPSADYHRFYVDDPFGNRLEFIEPV